MPRLTDHEGTVLLRMARQAVEECTRQHRLPRVERPREESLCAWCGAFVTLRQRGTLRGCIGHVEPSLPLFQTVRECAVAAARDDPRFEPVRPPELPELHIEISVLSALTEVRPEEVEVGRHGLLISRGSHRGLLLPQVAVQGHWDREQFLQETCIKAGLPADAWRHGARIQVFTAQVLSEPDNETNRQPTVHSLQEREG